MSARECLEHPWLQDEEIYVDMLQVMIILAMMMIKMMITFAGAWDILDEEMSGKKEMAQSFERSQGHAHNEEAHIPLCCTRSE